MTKINDVDRKQEVGNRNNITHSSVVTISTTQIISLNNFHDRCTCLSDRVTQGETLTFETNIQQRTDSEQRRVTRIHCGDHETCH